MLIDNASAGRLPSSLTNAGVVLEGAAGDSRPVEGTWRIIVSGRSIRWDAWLLDSALLSVARFLGDVVYDDRIAVPGTSRSAITVGSIVSRLDWPTFDGRDYIPGSADPMRTGGPSSFSAPGPTADGRYAPDVAAPGEYIIGAMSQDATPLVEGSVFAVDPNDPFALWADDGVHGVLRGTSQASPMVTGIIALLLEADPQLSGETIRELLRTTAAHIDGTAGWSPRVGFGRVDPGAAIALLRGARGGAPSADRSIVGVSRDLLPPDSEETTRVTVTPRDADDHPLGPGHTVAIELTAGAPLGDVIDVGAGRYERSFVAHAPRGAIGEVIATVDDTPLAAHPRVFYARARTEIGGDLTAGGGCDVGGGGGAGLALVAMIMMYLSRARAR